MTNAEKSSRSQRSRLRSWFEMVLVAPALAIAPSFVFAGIVAMSAN